MATTLGRNNLYSKFVLDEAGAYTTDTMHRVFVKNGVNKKAFIASYYNSLSFAFAEILGRNFGGGCLELMPSEVGGIYLPYKVENEQIYYTGKKFPSTVALNKLYYFMPYLKGKGIRDLYLIKIARVGTRREGQSGEDKNDFRLVFEIEFIQQLFDDYRPIELKIWRTFTDTTLQDVFK